MTLHNKQLKVCLLALIIIVVATACSTTSPDRQAEIATRGEAVMPFDLERSTHIFEKLDNGGLQQVVADDNDSEQIRLIREHLTEEASRFQEGDFHDPAMIHGEDMAGLHELTTNADSLTITYSEIDGGAQLLYIADAPPLVTALHQWFDQQVSDHGSHAVGN